MSYLHYSKSRSYTFDFRKKRVKETTVWHDNNDRETTRVMTKFEMGSALESCGGKHRWYGLQVTLYNSYSYDEVKQRLLEALEQENFENVTIIK